jgi:MFS family permease
VTNASLRPLRQRNFALVWSSALVSNIGSWMQTVAVGVFVTEATGQAKWTGLVAAAAFIPIGFLSPVGGAMADRVDRRKWLLLTTVGETAFAALLAVLVGVDVAGPGAVSGLVFLGGCMTSIGIPAYQAMLPDLVDEDDLLAGISLTSAQFNFGRVVGPALAGVVIAVGGYTWAFALNAASFFAVIVALLFVRLPPPIAAHDAEDGLWARIKEGARTAAREPGCRMAILLIGVVAFLLSPFIALVPAVALKLFDNERTGTSILITSQGVGAVAGALALAPLAERFGRRRTLVINLLVMPGLLMLYAATPTLWLATIAIFAVGAGYIGLLSGLMTVVQLRAPADVRGRVLSLFMVALGTIYPIGAVFQGALGDRIGLRATTIVCAAVFAALFALLVLRAPHLVDALDDPLATGENRGPITPPDETSTAAAPVA